VYYNHIKQDKIVKHNCGSFISQVASPIKSTCFCLPSGHHQVMSICYIHTHIHIYFYSSDPEMDTEHVNYI